MSLLEISEILRLFVYALTPDDKYSLRSSHNIQQPMQMELSKKKRFLISFAVILKSSSNFEHFKKEMTLIA